MDMFYTTEDVARLLKLKAETIRKYIREKKLYAVKLNRQYRISQDQLDEFLKLYNCQKEEEEENDAHTQYPDAKKRRSEAI